MAAAAPALNSCTTLSWHQLNPGRPSTSTALRMNPYGRRGACLLLRQQAAAAVARCEDRWKKGGNRAASWQFCIHPHPCRFAQASGALARPGANLPPPLIILSRIPAPSTPIVPLAIECLPCPPRFAPGYHVDPPECHASPGTLVLRPKATKIALQPAAAYSIPKCRLTR